MKHPVSSSAAARSDDWYYQLDGRIHGPYLWEAMSELIRSSGETASQVVVRRGDDAWVPFSDVLAVSKDTPSAVRAGHRQPAPADTAATAVTGVRQNSGDVRRRRLFSDVIRGNKDLVMLVAAWAMLNVGAAVWWQTRADATEIRYAHSLRRLEQDVKLIKAIDLAHGPQQELDDRRTKLDEALAPILADLDRTVDESRPIRVHLCLAAHQLPIMAGPTNQAAKDASRLFRKCMQYVEPYVPPE